VETLCEERDEERLVENAATSAGPSLLLRSAKGELREAASFGM